MRDLLTELGLGRWIAGVWRRPSTHFPIALSYLGSSASLIASSVMQLISLAILARLLGVEQFGQFLTMTALATVGVTFCGLGASEPLVRRVARDPSIYPTALGHNLILMGWSGAALVALLTAGLPWWVEVSPDPVYNLAGIAVFAVANMIFLRVVLLAEQAYIAHFDFKRANLVNLALAVTRLVSAALAYLVSVSTLMGWILWQAAGLLVLAMACVAALAPLGRPKWGLLEGEVSQGLFFSSASAVRVLKQSGDIVVLGLVASPAVVGSFGLARRIVETSFLTVDALFRLVYPRMSQAMETGISAGLELSAKILLAAVAIAATTALGLFIVAPLGPWLFGAEFAELVPDLRELCWLVIPAAVATTASGMLGASSNNGIRAVLSYGTLLGVVFIGAMTYAYSVTGTVLALYIVEFALAAAFWFAVLRLSQRERSRGAATSEGRTDA